MPDQREQRAQIDRVANVTIQSRNDESFWRVHVGRSAASAADHIHAAADNDPCTDCPKRNRNKPERSQIKQWFSPCGKVEGCIKSKEAVQASHVEDRLERVHFFFASRSTMSA